MYNMGYIWIEYLCRWAERFQGSKTTTELGHRFFSVVVVVVACNYIYMYNMGYIWIEYLCRWAERFQGSKTTTELGHRFFSVVVVVHYGCNILCPMLRLIYSARFYILICRYVVNAFTYLRLLKFSDVWTFGFFNDTFLYQYVEITWLL